MTNSRLYRVSLYSSAKHKLPIGRSELTLELGKNNGQLSIVNGQLLKASLSNVLFSTSLGEDERSGMVHRVGEQVGVRHVGQYHRQIARRRHRVPERQ